LVVSKAGGLIGINVNRQGSMSILGLGNHLSISLKREHRQYGQSHGLPDSSWPLTSNRVRKQGNPNASLPRVVLLYIQFISKWHCNRLSACPSWHRASEPDCIYSQDQWVGSFPKNLRPTPKHWAPEGCHEASSTLRTK